MFARCVGISEGIRRAMQWRFLQRYGVPCEEFERPHAVATIDAPALFIHNRDDQKTRFEGGIALATTWPNARLHATSGLGHRRILQDGAVINHTVDFLANRVEFRRASDADWQTVPMY